MEAAKRVGLAIILLCVSTLLEADEKNSVSAADPNQTNKLTFIKNYSGDNEIKLLNNRFRVDHHVEEVLMLFFRQNGSAPVVLIRPDGSKIYPKDANAKTIEWQAELGYDLIRLKNPTPGPWQAVGRILEDSKILVLSDLELEVDPLPNPLFQYEVLKTEARITNANKMISDGNFRNVVTLKATMYPPSDPDATNFGSDIYQVGEFKDNGRELDERPRDGVFTLQYYMQTAHGTWLPKYRLMADLFSRELTQDPVTVLPSPISFELTQAGLEDRYHYAKVIVDTEYLDNPTMALQGRVEYPNGDVETFSFQGLQERKIKMFNGEFGRFSIELEAFGNTIDGREVKFLIPTYQFVTMQPALPEPEVMEPIVDTKPVEIEPVIPPKPPFPYLLVILTNLVLFGIGFLFIWLFVLKKTITNPFAKYFKKKEAEVLEPIKMESEEKKPKMPNAPPSSDDILDLSLPED